MEEKSKKIKKHGSIGRKILIIMGILIVVYIALVEANISALYKIGDSTTVMEEVYLKLVSLEGEATTIVEQMRMYSYEAFNNYLLDTVDEKTAQLDESITKLESEIVEINNIVPSIDDAEIKDCVNNYINDLNNYRDFC